MQHNVVTTAKKSKINNVIHLLGNFEDLREGNCAADLIFLQNALAKSKQRGNLLNDDIKNLSRCTNMHDRCQFFNFNWVSAKLTPKLMAANLSKAEATLLEVVWAKKAFTLARIVLITAGTPGLM